MDINNLYQDILMDHYRHPRNRGSLSHADFSSAVHNPSCGDNVQFEGTFQDAFISRLMFQGSGCVISQGVASMLSEKLIGKSVDEIQSLDNDFVLAMLGMHLGPTRLKCALLPLQAIKTAISN